MTTCPECNGAITCLCVVGADQSVSGKTERLYQCEKCKRYWCSADNGRTFVGWKANTVPAKRNSFEIEVVND